jgi:hypothetical protein
MGSMLFACCLFGCGDGRHVDSDIVVIDIEESAVERSTPEIVDVRIVKLQTSDLSLLADISKIEIADSLILIQRDRDVLQFDMNGNYRAKVGMYGRGPGEYISIGAFYFDVSKKEIVIVDNYTNTLLRHGYDGKYISSSKLPDNSMKWANNIQPTSDGRLLVANQINKFDHNAYTLISTSESDAQNIFPVNITTGDYSYYFAKNPIAAIDDDIHFILPFDNRIFGYSQAGFDTLCTINTPLPMAPERVLSEIDDYNFASHKGVADKGFFSGFSDIFETELHMFLNYMHNGTAFAYYLIDKEARRGTAYMYSADFSNGIAPILPIIERYENYFVAPASISEIKRAADEMPAESPYFPVFKDIADVSKEDDNECLIFYKLKR